MSQSLDRNSLKAGYTQPPPEGSYETRLGGDKPMSLASSFTDSLRNELKGVSQLNNPPTQYTSTSVPPQSLRPSTQAMQVRQAQIASNQPRINASSKVPNPPLSGTIATSQQQDVILKKNVYVPESDNKILWFIGGVAGLYLLRSYGYI